MKLKVFTVNDVRRLNPCYDPVTGLDEDGNVIHPGGFVPETWKGTALDVLKLDACPVEDRLWVVCHPGWIDDSILRLFAVWCARQALRLVDNPDPRSVAACNVAERFATGRATSQELAAARGAAMDAAWAASKNAAEVSVRDAAWATVWATADDAAWSAARDSVEAAAWAAMDAAEAATRAAAENASRAAIRAADWTARVSAEAAANVAARDSGWTAWDAAWTAARKAQIEHLIGMLESED